MNQFTFPTEEESKKACIKEFPEEYEYQHRAGWYKAIEWLQSLQKPEQEAVRSAEEIAYKNGIAPCFEAVHACCIAAMEEYRSQPPSGEWYSREDMIKFGDMLTGYGELGSEKYLNNYIKSKKVKDGTT